MNFLNMVRLVCIVLILVKVIVISILVYILMHRHLYNSTEIEKCPYCYGKSFCSNFKNNEIILRTSTFHDVSSNYISSKNVYYANFNNVDVIVKKLASTDELTKFDSDLCEEHNMTEYCHLSNIIDNSDYKVKILNILNDRQSLLQPLRVCSKSAAEIMLQKFLSFNNTLKDIDFLKNVWTILKLNVEPLMLQLLSYDNNWPVPKYYGACGRFVVEENRGQPLNSKADDEWIIRAYFALQLLYAAKNFTDSHQDFRFYLTDISADNIAVDSSLKITFIDLENIVVVHKNMTDNNATHHSEVFDSENFAYSEESLCNSTISDHNYFAVCKLLLSKDAPWPMMKNGLLHSPPLAIAYKHKILFDLIEECVLPSSNDSRFVIINKVIDILQTILSEGTINELQNSTLYTL